MLRYRDELFSVTLDPLWLDWIYVHDVHTRQPHVQTGGTGL